jgi:serine/threonine-protein kinase HipA
MRSGKFRKAAVLFNRQKAGVVEETEKGYRFTYDDEFARKGSPISVSLPTTRVVHESMNLLAFFAGLLPEGWYLDIVSKKLKIDKNDTFGLLLGTCGETIGAVTIEELK